MRFSIVIPTFNAEDYIHDALSSIRAQSHQNYEVIVSDGGSTDRTLEILQDYSFPDIKIISEPDRGVPHALNRGFELATGEVFCWLNADDVYMNCRTLEIVAERIGGGVDVVIGGSAILNADGRVRATVIPFVTKSRPLDGTGNIFTGSLFFSRSKFEQFGGFDEKYSLAFEYELTRFLLDKAHFSCLPNLLAGFRKHGGGLSDVFRERMMEQRLELFHGRRGTRGFVYLYFRVMSHFATGTALSQIKKIFYNPYIDLHWTEVDDGPEL